MLDYTSKLPAKRMGAGALFFDNQDRVLMVQPTYKDEWEIPGGAVEADESPWQACRREIREELGLDEFPGRLLAIDWIPAAMDRTEGLMLVFEGRVLNEASIAAIRLPPEELRSFDFLTLPEAQIRVSTRMASRLAACFAARHDGTFAYLEDGRLLE